jgi:hypothetical protein
MTTTGLTINESPVKSVGINITGVTFNMRDASMLFVPWASTIRARKIEHPEVAPRGFVKGESEET